MCINAGLSPWKISMRINCYRPMYSLELDTFDEKSAMPESLPCFNALGCGRS